MSKSSDTLIRFRRLAAKLGYRRVIVGDYAFRNSAGKILRLVKAPADGRLIVWEEGVGRWEAR